MAMQPVVKPQETKPAPLPAYPVAPSSQTQTSSRGMVPPKHLAGGAAYAGVPKGVPHYDAGTTSVYDAPGTPRPTDPAYWRNSPPPLAGPIRILDPETPMASRTPFRQAVDGFLSGQAAKMGPQSASVPNALANYFVRPANAQVVQPPSGPVPAAPVTASTLMANAPSALAHAAFGAPGLARPNAAPFSGTLVHGGDNSLTPDPSGQYDVGQVGAPYPSSPQQVATAAAHTGANPAALQSAAGAARDAQVNPGQPRNMAADQHALANPQQYSSGNFVNALRGVSFRHLAMVAQALRTAMPYDPKTAAFNALQAHHVQNEAAMRTSDVNPVTGKPWAAEGPGSEAAAEAAEEATRQEEEQWFAGVSPQQKYFGMPPPNLNNQ